MLVYLTQIPESVVLLLLFVPCGCKQRYHSCQLTADTRLREEKAPPSAPEVQPVRRAMHTQTDQRRSGLDETSGGPLVQPPLTHACTHMLSRHIPASYVSPAGTSKIYQLDICLTVTWECEGAAGLALPFNVGMQVFLHLVLTSLPKRLQGLLLELPRLFHLA